MEIDGESVPWSEKYRPTTLNAVIGQTETIKNLQRCLAKKSFPHFIFTGTAGTGKTTSAFCFINDLCKLYNPNIHQLPPNQLLFRNASDKNKLSDNDEIKGFVFTITFVSDIPYKFVVLDECDNMTMDKQLALRKIIESAPPNVRFIFLCNYVENLAEPIISRCAVYHFYPLKPEEVKHDLVTILQQENITVPDHLISIIIQATRGDLRNAINTLQFMLLTPNQTEQQIYEYLNLLAPHLLNDIGMDIITGSFSHLELIYTVFPSSTSRCLLQQLLFWFLEQPFPFATLCKITNILAEFDLRFTEGADHKLQMASLFAELENCFLEED